MLGSRPGEAAALQARLVALLAARLAAPTERVDVHARFSRYGADSRVMTAVLADLGRELERPLGVTLAWEHPTVAELARALAGGAAATYDASTSGARRMTAAPIMAATADDPVAIVGLACRFPGASSPAAYFAALRAGVDAVRELPPERFDAALYDGDPDAPGHASTRWAGLLDDVDGFDAPFFGISRREATHMDPQQRLILELVWEALEDAGVPPRSLRGSRTGVFVGAMWSDYAALRRGSLRGIAQHTAVGEDLSIIPARVSYTLGLEGPSLSVNTACSSSLVALHLGRQSVASGESTLALVGGVNLILAPDSLVAMSKFGAMAPDGRSKAFDARANGYVRGEGAGVVALKRLSQARADGDRVYAVLLATAINNDGFSNGLTAPNPKAQESVLRDAYARAGVDPAEVGYIETHGTGTLLGDPIEANAIGAVLGRGPEAAPLYLGAVKTNIGHLEAAAGIAGLIKASLALYHGEIPPNLHFVTPNPHVPFAALGLMVPTAPTPWPASSASPSSNKGERRVAGVSSFGFGGTNAHAVLASDGAERPWLVPLAAADAAGVRAAAADAAVALTAGKGAREILRASGVLGDGDERPSCSAAASGRARAAIVAASRGEAATRLRALADGAPPAAIRVDGDVAHRGRLLFVFAPNGSQHRGMARTLYHDPVFARAFDACDAACAEAGLDWSLRAELLHGSDEARLDRIDVGQPLLFAVQYALAERLGAWGLRPAAVLGHSVGEVAAAAVAGALGLADAARVVVHRSRLMQQASGRGAMALVELDAAAVEPHLAPYGGAVLVAGYNGPRNTVVSGDAEAMTALLAALAAAGVEAHRVRRTDIAAHSAHMDPYRAPLAAALAGLQARPSALAIYSTVTAAPIEGHALDVDYWPRNLREPVAFEPALRCALADGYDAIVEISPHPLLVRALAALAGPGVTVVAAQHRDLDPRAALLEAVAELHRGGLAVDWARVHELPAPPSEPELFCLSAHDAPALAALAEAAAVTVENAAGDGPAHVPLDALGWAARTQRSHHEARAAVVADSHAGLAAELRRLGASVAEVGARALPREPGRLAFVFSGQGPQWWAMGRELCAHEPVFRGVFDACDRIVRRVAGWSLHEALGADEPSSRVHDVEVTQPALFALHAALYAQLGAWGVVPDAVAGHSLGEISAAWAAGALTLDDAVGLTLARARAMRGAVGRGRMLSADVAPDAVDLGPFGGRVALAALNGPRASVFAGEPGALAELAATLDAGGVTSRLLRGELAFHSPQMAPAARELAAAVAGLRPRPTRLPLYSTVTAAPIDGAALDAGYWSAQVTAPVRLADTVAALAAAGHTAFVELGPHPVLASAILQCLEGGAADGAPEGTCVPTLRRGRPERAALLEAIGELYSGGQRLDLGARRPASSARAELPRYPWQRRRYWLEIAPGPARDGDASLPAADEGDDGAEAGTLLARLAGVDAATRRALLEEHVARRVAAILMLAPNEAADPAQGFFDLGMDSRMVMRLRQELQRDLGRPLPGPVVFDYPTVKRLAAFLADGPAAPATAAQAATATTAPAGPRVVPLAPVPPAVPAPADVASLSRDEVERALLAELAALEEGAT